MSNVVPFTPDRRPRADRQAISETGQIVFFTGVRYVRFIDEEAADIAMAAIPVETDRDAATPVERLQA